ncbi:MAG: hypothetical protein JJ974_00165 [Phycisphaerales bacterium]|nr:hypothetical protein [Phycisphaerales bacterium]
MQHNETSSTGSVGAMARVARRMHWALLVGLGGLTMITGIGVLVSLMSPENLQSVPTVALVSVLVLLCVPVPVLMLERTHRKHAAFASDRQEDQLISVDQDAGLTTLSIVGRDRDSVIHASQVPHQSGFESHRGVRATTQRKRAV